MDSIKPPLGVMPRWIHDQKRLHALYEAMERYKERHFPIPKEWENEYQELLKNEEARTYSKR